jgi:two-component system, OmpR family, response regulator
VSGFDAVRVLVVEDNVKMARLLRRGLRDEGAAADIVTRGEDALWMARATDRARRSQRQMRGP